MRVFIDTSAWVAYFDKKDTNHESALKIWQQLKQEKAILCTTDYILDEMLTLLKIRANSDVALIAANAIMQSQSTEVIWVKEKLFMGALKLFKKYSDQRFSFTDCTSFEVMKASSIKKAFAFDSDFVKAGFETM
ncbi:MAG: type II toxin-antitoxin system VapC family toxin [Proteobacteria bacterium]|nr:type II toxin-antitoxin system VapC family toxin [Pseudomonadota bacterium]